MDKVTNKTTTAQGEMRHRRGKVEVVELNTTHDLQEYCADRTQLCFLGLLTGDVSVPKELEKFIKQQEIMRTVREKKESAPMEMMWINASCHPEILKAFDLDEMSIPTMVIYSPKKKICGNMIGRFDLESVRSYVESAFIGKTAGLRRMKNAPEIKETNCAALKAGKDEALSEEERKMLKEIIQEEERKKKEMQESEAASSKSKSKKKRKAKTGKSKKSKGKGKKKTDL